MIPVDAMSHESDFKMPSYLKYNWITNSLKLNFEQILKTNWQLCHSLCEQIPCCTKKCS